MNRGDTKGREEEAVNREEPLKRKGTKRQENREDRNEPRRQE